MHPIAVGETPYQEFIQRLQVNAYHVAQLTAIVVLKSGVSSFRVNEIESRFRTLATEALKAASTDNGFDRKALRARSFEIHDALLAEFEGSIAQASVTETS